MSLFNRYWKLDIDSDNVENLFSMSLLPDRFGQSLRIAFEINASVDVRYYTGVIKIYNLKPSHRKNLSFNLLLNEFGTGPKVQLTAGYEKRNGLIFNGVVHRGYTEREAGDWITTLKVGLPWKEDEIITIEPATNITTNNHLVNYLFQTIEAVRNQDGRLPINTGPKYQQNFNEAVNTFLGANNPKNKSTGYSGQAQQILDEISREYNLLFFVDHQGWNVTSKLYGDNKKTPITIPSNTTVPELILKSKTGLIGSPIYTDVGIKAKSYLRPEYRMFQYIRIESDVINRNISINGLIHRGDSYTNEWYSEIDGASYNQLKL
jgi:hypothetical protein